MDKHKQFVDSEEEEEEDVQIMDISDPSSDEEDANAPNPLQRQRDAAMARMQRYFGLEDDSLPTEPIVQDDSNYLRKMYWSCIQESGFPHRVNHAVAAHKSVVVWSCS